MPYTNEDGLLTRFGVEAGAVAPDGTANTGLQVLEVVIDSADLPVVGDISGDRPSLPANALVVDAFLVCNTAWTGTTPTLTVGLANAAGTAIDADAVNTAQAAAGDVVACDGALVDKTATIGSVAGWVYASTGGTVTAGKSTLYVRYMVPAV
jgi:hypothetical protein